jgi:hypothetical protein
MTKSKESEIFVFPKSAKIATIPLTLLASSAMIRSAGSNNPGVTRPLQSWELIDNIKNLINDAGHAFEEKEIWVEQRNSNRILTDDEMHIYSPENTPINKWMFDHILTKIDLAPAFRSEGQSPAIAISFNQGGIKICWGLHVHICQNLSIFGENSISTYGNQRVPFIKQMELLRYWIDHVDDKFQEDLKIATTLQMKEVDGTWIRETIGDLYIRAIEKAYKKGQPAPLNTGHLSTLVQKMNVEDVKSMWDFYNAGTTIIKPDNIFLEDVLDVNIAWGKYMAEKVS